MLRQKAREIPLSEIALPRVQDLIAMMKHTLAATPDGVGLAAPQVGESVQLFIVSEEAEEIDRLQREGRDRKRESPDQDKPYEKRKWKYYVFINPRILKQSRKKLDGPEGCLSVPGTFGNIKRHEKITMQAYNEHGKKFIRGESRFFARVMQHEIDHLGGMLFIDHATHIIKPS